MCKIEVPRDVRKSKSRNMTNSGENGLNIRTNASPKRDRKIIFLQEAPHASQDAHLTGLIFQIQIKSYSKS